MKLKVLILSMGLIYQGVIWAKGPTQEDWDNATIQSEEYPQENGSVYIPGDGGQDLSGNDFVITSDGKKFACTPNPKSCIDILGSDDGTRTGGSEGGNTGAEGGGEGGNAGAEGGEKPKKKWWKRKNKKDKGEKSTGDNGSESNPLQALRDVHSSNSVLETKIKRAGKNQGSSGTADEVKASAKVGPATSSPVIEYQDGDDVKLQRSEPAGYVDKSTCDQACRSTSNSTHTKSRGTKPSKHPLNVKKPSNPKKIKGKK